jgi:hypothetical protein
MLRRRNVIDRGAGLPGKLRCVRTGGRLISVCGLLGRKLRRESFRFLRVLAGHHLNLASSFCHAGSFCGAQRFGIPACFGFVVSPAAFCFHGFLHALARLLASLCP